MIFWLLRPVYFWDRPRFLRMLVEKAETKGVSYEDLVMVEMIVSLFSNTEEKHLLDLIHQTFIPYPSDPKHISPRIEF